MSFPPGTEMFQFPGFASYAYVFSARYPIGVGCPIRTLRDQSLLAAPPEFSQRATSFIASWCQGIHRMPFSCSNNPSCTGTTNTKRLAAPSPIIPAAGSLLAQHTLINAPEPCNATMLGQPASKHETSRTGSDTHTAASRTPQPSPAAA